jgi:CobQ-like glutamine amidotransferase family enzyme
MGRGSGILETEMTRPLTIAHLYPNSMNIYGDIGNVRTLVQRLRWRKLEVEVADVDLGPSDLSGADLIFMGGGQDRDQGLIYQDMVDHKREALRKAMDDEVPVLAVCGGYQLMGEYYLDASGKKLEGLGLLNLFTEAGDRRWIGNVLIETSLSIAPKTLVGFENHAGRTYLGEGLQPLGTVVVGGGNNGKDLGEGVVFKKLIGTYLHGSLLPKNPHLADWLIQAALTRREGTPIELVELDDRLEVRAHREATEIALREKGRQPVPTSSTAHGK